METARKDSDRFPGFVCAALGHSFVLPENDRIAYLMGKEKRE